MLARQFECELVRFMNTAIDTALTQMRLDLARLRIPAGFDWRSKSTLHTFGCPKSGFVEKHLFCKHFGVSEGGIVRKPFVS